MINIGDVFFCNVKKVPNIFWKSSDYIFIKSINEKYAHVINSQAEEKTLAVTFIQHLLDINILSRIGTDDEKAKCFLTSFGKVKKEDIMII